MDWSKTKTILIEIIIIINIVLFGFIFADYYKNMDRTIKHSFIEEVRNRLLDKNIKIDTNIPRTKSKLPSLLVEFESYSKTDINNRFFDSKGKIEDPNEEFTRITKDEEVISIINTRRIIYENLVEEEKDSINYTKAMEVAEEFLLRRGFSIDNMVCSYIEKSENNYILHYSKVFDGVIIEKSYTNFIINNENVLSMDRLWINVLEVSQNTLAVESAPKALLNLLDSDEIYDKTIEKIEQCYYFDPESQGFVEDITKAVQGRAIPAWRIEFRDGDSIVLGD